MADNVTISAFLELKDNMTSGVNKAVSELEHLNATAQQSVAAAHAMRAAHDASSQQIVAAIDRQTAHLKEFMSTATSAKSAVGTGGLATGVAQANESMTASILKGNMLSSVLLSVASSAITMGQEFMQSSVQLHNAIETTSIQIASSIKAFDLAPSMQSAQKMAIGTMQKIRDMAAVLPGEAEEYVKVFSLALPKAIESGMRDLDQIATLTSKYAAVAKMNLIDAQQAGMDMFRILAGQAGADVAMWTRLSAHINMTAEAFNKLPAPERLSLFATSIDQAGQGIGLYESTYESLLGTAMSLWAEIQAAGTEDMFSEIKVILQDLVGFLQHNREELIWIVELIGSGIVGGLKLVIGSVVLVEKGFGLIRLIVLAIQSAVQSISDSMGELAARIHGFFEDADGLAERIDNATKAAERYNTELERGRQQERDHERYMKTVNEQARQVENQEAERARQATQREHIKAQEWYSDLNKRMGVPDMGARAADVMKRLKAEVVSGKVTREHAVAYMAAKGLESFQSVFETELKKIPKEKKSKARGPKAHKATPKKDNFDFRYSKFNIRQEFAEGFDPDRIAVAFASDLGRLGEMKTAAAYAPLFTGG